MDEIDPITGLPKELSSWEDIAKENQTIEVTIKKGKFGKESTVVDGLDPKSVNLKEIAKGLKEKFACGGTVKDNKIELQGNHLSKIKDALSELGFDVSQVQIKYDKRGRR
jgi:translation initiation factor 1